MSIVQRGHPENGESQMKLERWKLIKLLLIRMYILWENTLALPLHLELGKLRFRDISMIAYLVGRSLLRMAILIYSNRSVFVNFKKLELSRHRAWLLSEMRDRPGNLLLEISFNELESLIHGRRLSNDRS